jgi:S-DNA-T family DNA segregation ATPase FtsK/SpoIIIE
MVQHHLFLSRGIWIVRACFGDARWRWLEEIEEDEEEAPRREPRVTGILGKKKKDEKKTEAMVLNANMPIESDYTPPPLSLLTKSKGKPDVGDITGNAEIIVHTLENFNINVEMDEISVGPSVTRYAMKPARGTKLSKIQGLQNELALALAAHPIRIEAPIPGTSLVGVEVPNSSRSSVGLGSMLAENEFQSTPKPLLISLGKGVSGKPYYDNIAKMPHMLIAGATGSGKSVTAHNIIVSLLYQHGPEYLRFIMVDPKRVELTLYDGIPHLLTPVIKTAKKAILALTWATKEMDRRYDVLESHKVRDIGSYHDTIVKPAYETAKKTKGEDIELPERMPYIVIMIDEMADLMQAYPRELEAAIVRLAQMSRAVGIHLVLSTQRPSVNVITGLIKANVPTRLALKVSSQIDSRTILDTAGAETLLGKGDMLYKGPEMSKPERIQSAFIPEDEVKKIAQFIVKNNRDYLADEIELPEHVEGDRAIASGSFDDSSDDDDGDPLFNDARDLVIKSGKASTSYIQRKLRVGYSRAARIMDLLEDAGIIGPPNGSKPREIIATEDDIATMEAADEAADGEEYYEEDDAYEDEDTDIEENHGEEEDEE